MLRLLSILGGAYVVLAAAVGNAQPVPPGYGVPSPTGGAPVLIVPYYGPGGYAGASAPYGAPAGSAARPISDADRAQLVRLLRCERVGTLAPLAGYGAILAGLFTWPTVSESGDAGVRLMVGGTMMVYGSLFAGDACALRTSRILRRSGRDGRRGLAIGSVFATIGVPYAAQALLLVHQRRVRAELGAEGILPARGRLRSVAVTPWLAPGGGVVGTSVVGAF